MFYFPATSTNTSPSLEFMNLVRGSNAWLLLASSLAICVIVPYLVSFLAIYFASAIPWSTNLAWVVNTIYQDVFRQPTLAPTVRLALLSLSIWSSKSLTQPFAQLTVPSPPFIRDQRRASRDSSRRVGFATL